MKTPKNKIGACLWFDHQAEAAANFYAGLFENSKIDQTTKYTKEWAAMSGKKEGDVMTVGFQLENMNFMGLNGGPLFQINPAISFFVNCETEAEVDELWEKLSEKGQALMPLDKYDYSEKYGWVKDKFGLSWQVILSKPDGDWRPKIIPSFLFTNEKSGKTKEAIEFYVSVFDNSTIGLIAPNDKPGAEGTTAFADFSLENTWFTAMDSPIHNAFGFNEAVSFMVNCETQTEIDYYWEKLSAVPASEQCGWLKDKYGISWQIVPKILPELLNDTDPEKAKRITATLMQMKKLDIKKLEDA